MSPILGIWASQNYVRIAPSSYESIATVSVGAGGTSAATFSSIPSTYKHLQVRIVSQTSRASFNFDFLDMQFNGVSATNKYVTHRIKGTGSAVSAQYLASSDEIAIRFDQVVGGTSSFSTFGTLIIDILDYANSSKNKTVRSLGGNDYNGGGDIYFTSGLFLETTAINRIDFFNPANRAWSAGTSFALYGIKG